MSQYEYCKNKLQHVYCDKKFWNLKSKWANQVKHIPSHPRGVRWQTPPLLLVGHAFSYSSTFIFGGSRLLLFQSMRSGLFFVGRSFFCVCPSTAPLWHVHALRTKCVCKPVNTKHILFCSFCNTASADAYLYTRCHHRCPQCNARCNAASSTASLDAPCHHCCPQWNTQCNTPCEAD